MDSKGSLNHVCTCSLITGLFLIKACEHTHTQSLLLKFSYSCCMKNQVSSVIITVRM